MVKRFLNTQTKNITLASLILGTAYLTSTLLGLLRDRLLASRFGAGNELDIYYAAFRIPDFVAMILIIGAISAAIIPVFNKYLVRSKEEAWKFTSALLNWFLLCLIVVCSILLVITPYLISFIVPGFEGEKRELTILLTRIMFLSPIILGISNILSGILQVFHRFLVTALAPLMYNLGIISGILFFVPKMGLPGLALGVVLGAVLHLLIQIPIFYICGFRYRRIFFFRHPGVWKVIKLMVPRSLGLAASQINLIIVTAIASTLISGSIAVFNLANNLAHIGIGLVAVPFSTAVFPFLSSAFSMNKRKEFMQSFSSVFSQILFLVIPLSALLFMLRAQIVRIVLGTGQFSWADTQLTAACLGIFSLGLFAQGLVLLISKTFYATHNTKIPALVSFISVIFAIGMSFLFVWLLGFQNVISKFVASILDIQGIAGLAVIGLPLAVSISAIFQLCLLLILFYNKIEGFKLKTICDSSSRIFISTIIMTFFVYFVRQILGSVGFINMRTFLGVFCQTAGSALAGIFIYILIMVFLKSPEIKAIKSSLLRQFLK